MGITLIKLPLVNHNFVIPVPADETIDGFCAAEEITPGKTKANVYVAATKNIIDALVSQNGKTDVTAQSETLHLKDAKDKADKKDKDKEPKKVEDAKK